jgi:hypothetical protein
LARPIRFCVLGKECGRCLDWREYKRRRSADWKARRSCFPAHDLTIAISSPNQM